MKKLIAILVATTFISSSSPLAAAESNNGVGSWNGTLESGSIKLRVVFKISKDAGGGLTAKMDSIDQGARNIPVDTVNVNDNVLHMEVNAVHGVYEGALDGAGTKATGTWTQGAQSLPLTLEKGEASNSAFETETLSPVDQAANKKAALKLAGTWNGTLATGAANLRLRVNLSKSSGGTATGTMDSLDQGANGIPLSAITLKGDEVRFEARGIGGVYEGTLAADGASFAGQWRQGAGAFPLELKKATTE